MTQRLNITMDDRLLARADEFAKGNRYTRSGLIAAALEAFLVASPSPPEVVREQPAAYAPADGHAVALIEAVLATLQSPVPAAQPAKRPEILGGKSHPNRAVYLDALRRMSAEQRLTKAFELTEMTREATRAGLRHRHPDASEDEIQAMLVRRLMR